jgi:molybdopterin synthase sulfur carrier subunit
MSRKSSKKIDKGESMSVRVHIPTPMRQHTEGQATVEAQGSSVKAVLDNVGTKYPAINQRLFENGQVRRFVNVYLNDEDIRYLDNLNTAVKDGDEISIIPAVAGG